jgi:hypothetical protein
MTDLSGRVLGSQGGVRENLVEAVDLDESVWGALTEGLAALEGETPPDGLTDRIMAGLRPKRPPWWSRAWKWLYAPKTITFSPARLAPLLGAVVLVLALVTVQDHYRNKFGPAGRMANTDLIPIVFSLDRAEAGSVYVIGSFNYWNPDGYEMHRDEKSGVWHLKVALPAGSYEYSFLIDGRTPVADPKAVFTKQDGFGNENAVVYVEKGPSI